MVGVWAIAGTVALAAPEVSGEVAPRGAVADRIATDDGADLVLFYGSEQGGVIGTCGCDLYPKGGLGRVETLVDAAREASPDTPALLVNAGGWLASDRARSGLSDEAQQINDWMLRALRLGSWDVLNVGHDDLPGLAVSGEYRPGLVSANLRPPPDHPVVRYTVVEAGEHRVAFTGLSHPGAGFLFPDGTRTPPAFAALDALMPELRQDADVVVVLVHDLPQLVPAVASLDGVDVVIEASGYRERYDPFVEGDAVWVRSWERTTRLGELRLWLDDGRVTRALDRKHDLDPDLPVGDAFRRVERRAAEAGVVAAD